MPLYEYQCPVDGTFELMRKFSDPPLTNCPKCGRPVEKLLSAPAIQFKGTGWYITDYARKSSPPGADKGAPEKKASESSGSKDPGSSSTSSSGGGKTEQKK